MKIAVLGANGFLGKHIVKWFSHEHTVTPITRQTIDLLNPISVKNELQQNRYDVIINSAASYTENHDLTDARNNLGMFMNFYNNSDLFGKFINLGSGAEFDREQNIEQATEELIFERSPNDSYGFGHNVKSRLCYERHNFYTIRIFNCFGPGEKHSRIFPRFLSCEDTLEITNDRFFDYFSVRDLCYLIQDCIVRDWNLKDVNAVYAEKLRISDALRLFCRVNNMPERFSISSISSNNYTGDSKKISSLNLPLTGIVQGFKDYLI